MKFDNLNDFDSIFCGFLQTITSWQDGYATIRLTIQDLESFCVKKLVILEKYKVAVNMIQQQIQREQEKEQKLNQMQK